MMKKSLMMLACAAVLAGNAGAEVSSETKESKKADEMIYRISEIEIDPAFAEAYWKAAVAVGETSVKEEPGVVAIFPMVVKRDKTQIRILEIYRDEAAYKSHIASSHFQTYKKGTLHMVKKLDLVDTEPMKPELLPLVFRKAEPKE